MPVGLKNRGISITSLIGAQTVARLFDWAEEVRTDPTRDVMMFEGITL